MRHVHAIEDVTDIWNETFVETTGAGTFVTMLIMLVDSIGGRVHFIRAGHNPPLTITSSGDTVLFDRGGGPPVGLFSNIQYRREISSVEPGSVLVVYTDGVSEAENSDGDQLGVDRLATVITTARSKSASEIHASIRARLKDSSATPLLTTTARLSC